MLEDANIDVKIKLSLLWVALMFFYLYNDVFSLFRRDIVEEVLSGEMGGIQINQVFLFGARARKNQMNITNINLMKKPSGGKMQLKD